jgi:hypothetical protein
VETSSEPLGLKSSRNAQPWTSLPAGELLYFLTTAYFYGQLKK